MDPRRLREETRTEHESTEALMPLTGEGLTRDVYMRTLSVLYPLLLSWEAWSSESAPEGLRPLLTARRRSHLLRADLAALGGKAEPGTGFQVDWGSVVGFQDRGREDAEFRAAFLGALYVLEGSTLGGRFIARHVQSALGMIPGEGDAYFQGHGEATGGLWREVTAEIAEVPDEFGPVVVEAAKRTFHAFGRALQMGKLAPVTVHG